MASRPLILIACLVCLPVLATFSSGAVVTEDFEAGAAGWIGTGDLSVSGTNGYLAGVFQDSPLSGSFRAESGSSNGDFVGDLTRYADFASIRFDFMAEDAFPAGTALRFRGANNVTFSFGFSLNSIGSFQSVVIPTTFSSGWVGGTQAEFDTAFAAVQWMDVFMFAPAPLPGDPPSTFRLDNFAFSSVLPTAIPEPGHSVLMVIGFVMIMTLRNRTGALLALGTGHGGTVANATDWDRPIKRRSRRSRSKAKSFMVSVLPRGL